MSIDTAARTVSLDPHDPAFVQDPYPAYARLHAECPAFFWRQYGIWCFAGHDDVNRLLRDRRFGRENRWGAPLHVVEGREHLAAFDALEAHSLLEREPPEHTRLRALVNRAFVSRQVDRLRPRIAALAEELIDGFEADREADLLPAFATPVPITVICEMLGVPVADAPRLLDWSHRIVGMYMHGRTRADEDSANAASEAFAGYLHALIAERRGRPGDDLLSTLIAARDHGDRLSEDELVTTVVLLLNAGHEATVHQTGNAIRTILLSGADPAALFADDAATERTVEECLRHDAPLHLFTRYAYERVESAPGIVIEPGQTIGLMLGAANRDPAAFVEPERFSPDRRDQKNVTFGAGIHFCIGAPLARIEMQESLKALFRRLPKLRLAEPPRFRDIYHFHGLERLTCRW